MLQGSAIDVTELDVATVINESLTPAASSALLAEIARETLAEAERQNRTALGYTPGHSTEVDGRSGTSEDNVRPAGEIVYTFDLLTDLFSWILQMLEQFAPVRSGRFKASFELFADGVLVDPAGEIPQASEYVFLSSAAYAREIEGDGSRGPESKQAPNGVFEAVAVLAQQRFGNQANITFSYREPLGAVILNSGDRSAGRTPAITITTGS